MTKVYAIPFEINDNNSGVFKIIEGKDKDKLVTFKLKDIDYLFLNELFLEAENDSDIDTPVLRLDLSEQTILNEVE